MTDPVSALSAFIAAKLSALLWSLGAALATLSFIDESSINRKFSLWRGFANLLASWFVGFALGGAINHELGKSQWEGMVYVVSTTVGLLIIGGLYKLAHAFRHEPEDFMTRWWKIWRK